MTDTAALPRDSVRAYAWPALTLLAFVPLQVAALLVADRITRALGVGDPEREHFAVVAALIGGAVMLLAVPLIGRLLGRRPPLWAGWKFAAPIALAAVTAFALFEDSRSGHRFETDHAIPEIFLPSLVILLASAALGRRLGGGGAGWIWLIRATAALTIVLVGLTLAKMATTGGDFALDSPLTVAVLVLIGAVVYMYIRHPNPATHR